MTALYGDRLGEGAFVDGYVVEQHAAQGTSADVYRARGPTGATAALKVLKRELVFDATALARFRDEARCLTAVVHPNLVRLEASGDLADGRPWLALEWLTGQSCEQLLSREGAQPLERVCSLLKAVASALGALHAKGYVHRDVSSHNVMWCADGRVVLLDFGVARSEARSTQLTSTGHLLGTPLALAPEVLAGGPASPASDLYALGVLGWALLHGEAPFKASSLFELSQLHARQVLPPWRRADASPLEPVLRRCLAASPEARPRSAEELEEMLGLKSGQDLAVEVYVCARGEPEDADAFDAWEGALREAARGLGLVTLVDGAALLLALRVTDEADGRRWESKLARWLEEVRSAAPRGVELEARTRLTQAG